MPSYQIKINNEYEFGLYFETGATCTVTINGSMDLDFTDHNGVLLISSNSFSFSMLDVTEAPLDIEVEEFAGSFEQFMGAATNENCCVIGDNEICVTGGCMNTPCGKICG